MYCALDIGMSYGHGACESYRATVAMHYNSRGHLCMYIIVRISVLVVACFMSARANGPRTQGKKSKGEHVLGVQEGPAGAACNGVTKNTASRTKCS